MTTAVQDETTPLLANTRDEEQGGNTPSQLSRYTRANPLPMKRVIVLNVLNAMQPLVFELIFPFVSELELLHSYSVVYAEHTYC
jgi:hypothetical protein